ncbi:dUTPase [Vibrio phage 1.081.O._10N.286.52.C2]|nr:dUTPase [Vibrio phage 1.081.O._10N.286.52.C2]
MKLIYLPHYKENKHNELQDFIPPLKNMDIDDAGIDMRAAIIGDIKLAPGEDAVIPSGVKIHIGSDETHNAFVQMGLYGCILPRSGLGFKHYLRLANTAGVIDANYQGEIMIKIRNEGDDTLHIARGDRICQIIFQYYRKGVQFNVVDKFDDETARGAKGFGASGVS